MTLISRIASALIVTVFSGGAVLAQTAASPPPTGTPGPPSTPPLQPGLQQKGQIGNPADSVRSLPQAVDPEKAKAAEQATRTWVELLDTSKYDESWRAASGLFQSRIPVAEWSKAISAKRGPYGAVKSRVFLSVAPGNAIPGAPIADYMTVRYSTEFEHGPAPVVTEIVTTALERDGSWRITGYGLP